MPKRTAIAIFVLVDILVIGGVGYAFRNYFWHYCETNQCKSNPKGVYSASKPSI